MSLPGCYVTGDVGPAIGLLMEGPSPFRVLLIDPIRSFLVRSGGKYQGKSS